MAVVLFLEKDIQQQNVRDIEERLRQTETVHEYQFVSTEEAWEKFRQTFPELQNVVEHLQTNPFPPSFEVSFDEKTVSPSEVNKFIDQAKEIPGIEDVQFNQDWVEKMQSFSRLAQAVGFFLGGILIMTSFFIISNVIRLNVFARADEIEILRLVGGTNLFIRVPFLLEGMALGLLGGLSSLLVLFILIKIFPIYLGSSLGMLTEFINFRYLTSSQSLAVVFGGAFIGFLGSMSSLSRFLKA